MSEHSAFNINASYRKREQRARAFTYGVIGIMRDFLPSDNDCRRKIEQYLYEMAYEQNFQIINVPPEMDELEKLQIEKALLKNAIQVIMPDGEII